jgi:ParB family chromosome partitioning protein
MVGRNELSAGHARALLGLEDTAYAIHIAERVVAEGWSVRQVEDAVKTRTGQGSPRSTPVPRPRPAAIIELEDRLGERLGTAVKIAHGKRGGKVSIKYSSLDDLERIYRLLN